MPPAKQRGSMATCVPRKIGTRRMSRLLQLRQESVRIEVKVRKDYLSFRINNGEPGRTAGLVVRHEARQPLSYLGNIVTEQDGKVVLYLVGAQLIERVLKLALKDRLDNRKTHPSGSQGDAKTLQRRKAVLMASATPVLKREEDLHACTQIRQFHWRLQDFAVGTDPSLYPELRRTLFGCCHINLLAFVRPTDVKSGHRQALTTTPNEAGSFGTTQPAHGE